MSRTVQTLVIGIGNKYRSDDGVGLWVAERLQGKAADCEIAESSGEITQLLELWRNFSRVLVVDATASGTQPGTIFRFEAQKEALPAETFHYSSHAIGLPEAIELARTLGALPAQLVVYGIEGKNFAAGEVFSSEVQRAAEQLTEKMLEELKRESANASPGGL
jgi:hydrogenase maturation protease